MRKWILILPIILAFVSVTPVMADTTQDVTVYATPGASGGISGFTITYISDTQLDLTWGLVGDATNIMIRAKYGQYPANIPDILTAPSDGYLVYSGNGTSVSDTSMNFNENPGKLYYVAWAQKADGTWFMNISTGWKESKRMILLFFGLLIGIMCFGAIRSTYYIFWLLAGASLWGAGAYLIYNPLVAGANPVNDIILIICFVGGLVLMFGMNWRTKTNNGESRGGFNFRLPKALGGQSEDEEIVERQQRARTWRDRQASYNERLNNAIAGKRIPPR